MSFRFMILFLSISCVYFEKIRWNPHWHKASHEKDKWGGEPLLALGNRRTQKPLLCQSWSKTVLPQTGSSAFLSGRKPGIFQTPDFGLSGNYLLWQTKKPGVSKITAKSTRKRRKTCTWIFVFVRVGPLFFKLFRCRFFQAKNIFVPALQKM